MSASCWRALVAAVARSECTQSPPKHVLTLSRKYFRLRRSLERRLYELARKHCGHQRGWRIGLEPLRAKCGSESSIREFRRLIRRILVSDSKEDYMPDYAFTLDGDILVVRNKNWSEPGESPVAPMDAAPLSPAVFAEGRRLAPGWDIYALEREWRGWVRKKKIAVRHPEQHFASFCRARGPYPC